MRKGKRENKSKERVTKKLDKLPGELHTYMYQLLPRCFQPNPAHQIQGPKESNLSNLQKIRILSYINIAIEVYFVMVDLVGILLVFSLPNIVR